jgi:hypothetical protein
VLKCDCNEEGINNGDDEPRQSLRKGRQKSISPQGSGFEKWKQARVPIVNGSTPSNTLAWHVSVTKRNLMTMMMMLPRAASIIGES